jgi:glyoxylase-like metal-dependent hydrolase (beta-lactamase superfamily II)
MNDTASTETGRQAPGFFRFKLGAFTGLALHDGVFVRDRPDGFVPNAGSDEVGEAYAAAGMERDKLTLTFNALAIETGNGVVLIDTGLGEGARPAAGQLLGNLAAAGLEPEDVTSVIISHFHGDHIGGLRRSDGALAFPKAEVLVPEAEWNFWMGDASGLPDALKDAAAAAHRTFDPIAKDVRRFAFGQEILPGFTAVDASGHTPGMAAIEIASGNAATMFVADITNNPLVFARHPDWQAMFDMDPEKTIATRKRLLDRAAADHLRLSFFHAPFPATGYVIKSGNGYDYVPALWTAS